MFLRVAESLKVSPGATVAGGAFTASTMRSGVSGAGEVVWEGMPMAVKITKDAIPWDCYADSVSGQVFSPSVSPTEMRPLGARHTRCG